VLFANTIAESWVLHWVWQLYWKCIHLHEQFLQAVDDWDHSTVIRCLCMHCIIVTCWSGSDGISSRQPTGFFHWFDTVGFIIWPVKIVPEMTYNVLNGTLSLYTTYLPWPLLTYSEDSALTALPVKNTARKIKWLGGTANKTDFISISDVLGYRRFYCQIWNLSWCLVFVWIHAWCKLKLILCLLERFYDTVMLAFSFISVSSCMKWIVVLCSVAGHVTMVGCVFTMLRRTQSHWQNGGIHGAVRCLTSHWPIIYSRTIHRRMRPSHTMSMSLLSRLLRQLLQRGSRVTQTQIRRKTRPTHWHQSLMIQPSWSTHMSGYIQSFSTTANLATTLSVVDTASKWWTECQLLW